MKIISTGSNPKQGVAYLPDGTMIVVDDAKQFAGTSRPVEIVFERYLQTAAGKMMFAKLAPAKSAKTPKRGRKSTGRKPKKTDH